MVHSPLSWVTTTSPIDSHPATGTYRWTGSISRSHTREPLACRTGSGYSDMPLDGIDQQIAHTRAAQAVTVLEALAVGTTHPHYLEPVRCLQAHLLWCSGRPLSARAYFAEPACTSSYAN